MDGDKYSVILIRNNQNASAADCHPGEAKRSMDHTAKESVVLLRQNALCSCNSDGATKVTQTSVSCIIG